MMKTSMEQRWKMMRKGMVVTKIFPVMMKAEKMPDMVEKIKMLNMVKKIKMPEQMEYRQVARADGTPSP
jgi:hypothetical protein